MKTMKMEAGFTLIELMIVGAIIAILAVVAIPQYNVYTARSQFSEAVALLGGLKVPVGEAFAHDGATTSCTIPPGSVTTGKYVVALTATAASPCTLTATFKASGVSTALAGQNVTATYTPETGEWDCSSSAPPQIKPKGCS